MTAIPEGSADWFTARHGIPTCSVLDDVMSEGKKPGTPGARFLSLVDLKAWEVISGQAYSGGTGFAAQRGIELEPVALRLYGESRGVKWTKPGFVRHPTLAFGGSPDAIAEDGHCIEVKAPETPAKVIQARFGGVEDYRQQVQGQMCITGARWCALVVYDDRLPPDEALTVVRIDRDDAQIAKIESRVQQFNEAVAARVAEFRGAR
jgi:hypothetical protein